MLQETSIALTTNISTKGPEIVPKLFFEKRTEFLEKRNKLDNETDNEVSGSYLGDSILFGFEESSDEKVIEEQLISPMNIGNEDILDLETEDITEKEKTPRLFCSLNSETLSFSAINNDYDFALIRFPKIKKPPFVIFDSQNFGCDKSLISHIKVQDGDLLILGNKGLIQHTGELIEKLQTLVKKKKISENKICATTIATALSNDFIKESNDGFLIASWISKSI